MSFTPPESSPALQRMPDRNSLIYPLLDIERSIDQTLAEGEYSSVAGYYNIALAKAPEFRDRIVITRLSRIEQKYLALPVYKWLDLDHQGMNPNASPELMGELQAMYGQCTEILEQYLVLFDELERGTDEYGKIEGQATELTCLSLVARGISNDLYTDYIMIPSNAEDDISNDVQNAAIDYRSNFDFYFINRRANTIKKTEVKTTTGLLFKKKPYAQDITVVDMSQISGGNMWSLRKLQLELCAETRGDSNYDKDHILMASRALRAIFDGRSQTT